MAGRPVVVYKSSPITMVGGVDNPMVGKGSRQPGRTFDTVEAIPPALGEAVTTFEKDAGEPYAAPPNVASVIEQGEQVFTWLVDNRMPRDDLEELTRWTAGLVKETKTELISDEEVTEWTAKLIGLLGRCGYAPGSKRSYRRQCACARGTRLSVRGLPFPTAATS